MAQAAAGFAQAGADTATMVTQCMSTYYQLQAASQAQRQAYSLAMLQRSDQLRQNQFQNQIAQDQMKLSKNQLTWDQVKFGKTFKFTKQQYIDERNRLLREETRQTNKDAIDNLVSMYGLQGNAQNRLRSQIGG